MSDIDLRIAELEANIYERYIHYLEEEDQVIVQKLLDEYRLHPSLDLMRKIDIEFAPEINKIVAVERYKFEQEILKDINEIDTKQSKYTKLKENLKYLIYPETIPTKMSAKMLKYLTSHSFESIVEFNEDYENNGGYINLRIDKEWNESDKYFYLFSIINAFMLKLLWNTNLEKNKDILLIHEKLWNIFEYYLENFEELIKRENINTRPYNNKKIVFRLDNKHFASYTLDFKNYFLGGMFTPNLINKTFECLLIILKYYHINFVDYYTMPNFYELILLTYKIFKNFDFSNISELKTAPVCMAYFMMRYCIEQEKISDKKQIVFSLIKEIENTKNIENNSLLEENDEELKLLKEQFVSEKNKLNILERTNAVVKLIRESNLQKAYEDIETLCLEFEKGLTFENQKHFCLFDFSDEVEFLVYIAEHRDASVEYIRGNYYTMYKTLAYLLLEYEDLDGAEQALIKARRWNPIAPDITLEHVEIEIKKGNILKSIELIKNALRYTTTPMYFALCYRKLGYCYTELKQYDVASALYLHSLLFEESEVVAEELAYIKSITNQSIVFPKYKNEIEDLLLENNILLEASNLVKGAFYKLLKSCEDNNDKDGFVYYLDRFKQLLTTEEILETLQNIKIPNNK